MALVVGIGVSVAKALAAFADGAWGSPYAVAASINRALALALVGLGFVLAAARQPHQRRRRGADRGRRHRRHRRRLYGGGPALPAPLSFVLPMLAAAVAGGALGRHRRRAQGQGRHQRGHQHAAALVHRRLDRLRLGAVRGPAAPADDEHGDPAGVAGDPRRDQAAAAQRRRRHAAARRPADRARDRRRRRASRSTRRCSGLRLRAIGLEPARGPPRRHAHRAGHRAGRCSSPAPSAAWPGPSCCKATRAA